jgi:hypothetical protein
MKLYVQPRGKVVSGSGNLMRDPDIVSVEMCSGLHACVSMTGLRKMPSFNRRAHRRAGKKGGH